MARPPRTFARGSHPEAKARENIGQGKRREDVSEGCKQTNHQRESVEVLSTRGLRCFVRMTGLLRRLRAGGFCRTRCERVFSLKQRSCNEANQDHPAQQSPHENDWLPGNKNSHG